LIIANHILCHLKKYDKIAGILKINCIIEQNEEKLI